MSAFPGFGITVEGGTELVVDRRLIGVTNMSSTFDLGQPLSLKELSPSDLCLYFSNAVYISSVSTEIRRANNC